MKQGLIKTIAVSCLMVLQLSAQVAQAQAKEGNSSGGGTGDNVFELQQAMSESNAEPFEVLEKAFNESLGNLPRMIGQPRSESCDNGCFSNGRLDYQSGDYVAYANKNVGNRANRGFFQISSTHFIKAGNANAQGPLFNSNKDLSSVWYSADSFNDDARARRLLLKIKDNIMEVTEVYGTRWSDSRKIEIREYRPGIAVYKITGESSLTCHFYGPENQKTVPCLIGYGYAWK